MKEITDLLNQYGYIVLLIALFLELIAFPLPGELLMTYCGYLVYEGKLNYYICILFASLGTILGITTSYLLGYRYGSTFFYRYGRYVHLGPERLKKTSDFFETFGNRLLIFAFFIIGVRHITGYFSGITKISYKRFAFNAYLGAFVWSLSFITLGKLFGSEWSSLYHKTSRYLVIIATGIILILISIYIYRSYRKQIIESIHYLLKKLFSMYHSYTKTKLLITSIIILTSTTLVLIFGLIQDFLNNEFTSFDTITSLIIKNLFNDDWLFLMNFFLFFLNIPTLIYAAFLLLIWVSRYGKLKTLEIRVLILSIGLGQVIQIILSEFFHHFQSQYHFPNEQAFMGFIIYGLILYTLFSYHQLFIVKHISTVVFILFMLFFGISLIYLDQAHPIEVIAGYAFGAFWLGLNLILFEINKLILEMKKSSK